MYKDILKSIQNAHHIVIISHINPDGDTIGSMIGLGESLGNLGKKITYFNVQKSLPSKYDFLPNFKKIKSVFPKKYDLVISVDAASFDRLGIDKNIKVDINFDHHKSNTNFATINVINPNSVSTSLIIYDFLKKCDIKIIRNSAISLYMALVEDSGFFKFDRVDSDTFLKASDLVNLGADPSYIADNLTNRNSLAKLRIMEIYLRNMELLNRAKIAFCKITLDDFKSSGASISDTDELVYIGLTLTTVEISIFMYEIDYKKVKVSLRSKDSSRDVSKIAIKYGGGGHKKAAGFTADIKDIDDIIQYICSQGDL